jgi:hypothetical protein
MRCHQILRAFCCRHDKLVGEGFDHPARHVGAGDACIVEGDVTTVRRPIAPRSGAKIDVRTIDFVDTGHSALLRMWAKRQRGDKAMGYRVKKSHTTDIVFESDGSEGDMLEMEMFSPRRK